MHSDNPFNNSYRSFFVNCSVASDIVKNAFVACDYSCFYNCDAKLEATIYDTDGNGTSLTGYSNYKAQYYSCRCTLNVNINVVMPVDRYYSTTANSRAFGYGFISQGENTVYHNCNASISCVSYISYMANDTYGPYQACYADSIAYGFQYSPKSGDVISGCNATLSVSATAEYSRYVEGKATEEKCELYNMDNGECEGES